MRSRRPPRPSSCFGTRSGSATAGSPTPADSRVGAGGGSATLGAFEQTRPLVAAQALGIGRAALEFACDRARAVDGGAEPPLSAGRGLDVEAAAVRIAEQAVQVAGDRGYIRDHPVEKWYRDAKLYTIFEGTSEIQRLVIGRTLGDATTEAPLHHRTRTDGVALGRAIGRGTKRRSLAAGAAMRAAQRTPPGLLAPAMRILGPPQKPREG